MLCCAAALCACTSKREAAAPPAASARPVYQEQHRIGYDALGRAVPAVLSAVVVTGTEEGLPFISQPDVTGNMVIRTANASLEVDSLEPAIALVKQLAARVGGYVANAGMEVGKNRLHSATLEVKIPAPRFEEGLAGLTPIGKLESVNVSAEDVGEEYVDVSARMENARRLERRLIDLLANRAGKLKEVLDVEQALARVREEIERYEGRIRYLRAHTATSTLSVYVHEPVPVVGTAGRSVIGEAARQAWRNFVTLVSLGVQSLGVTIPLGVLVFIFWTGNRRWRWLSRARAA
jgi:hypothetical protein